MSRPDEVKEKQPIPQKTLDFIPEMELEYDALLNGWMWDRRLFGKDFGIPDDVWMTWGLGCAEVLRKHRGGESPCSPSAISTWAKKVSARAVQTVGFQSASHGKAGATYHEAWDIGEREEKARQREHLLLLCKQWNESIKQAPQEESEMAHPHKYHRYDRKNRRYTIPSKEEKDPLGDLLEVLAMDLGQDPDEKTLRYVIKEILGHNLLASHRELLRLWCCAAASRALSWGDDNGKHGDRPIKEAWDTLQVCVDSTHAPGMGQEDKNAAIHAWSVGGGWWGGDLVKYAATRDLSHMFNWLISNAGSLYHADSDVWAPAPDAHAWLASTMGDLLRLYQDTRSMRATWEGWLEKQRERVAETQELPQEEPTVAFELPVGEPVTLTVTRDDEGKQALYMNGQELAPVAKGETPEETPKGTSRKKRRGRTGRHPEAPQCSEEDLEGLSGPRRAAVLAGVPVDVARLAHNIDIRRNLSRMEARICLTGCEHPQYGAVRWKQYYTDGVLEEETIYGTSQKEEDQDRAGQGAEGAAQKVQGVSAELVAEDEIRHLTGEDLERLSSVARKNGNPTTIHTFGVKAEPSAEEMERLMTRVAQQMAAQIPGYSLDFSPDTVVRQVVRAAAESARAGLLHEIYEQGSFGLSVGQKVPVARAQPVDIASAWEEALSTIASQVEKLGEDLALTRSMLASAVEGGVESEDRYSDRLQAIQDEIKADLVETDQNNANRYAGLLREAHEARSSQGAMGARLGEVIEAQRQGFALICDEIGYLRGAISDLHGKGKDVRSDILRQGERIAAIGADCQKILAAHHGLSAAVGGWGEKQAATSHLLVDLCGFMEEHSSLTGEGFKDVDQSIQTLGYNLGAYCDCRCDECAGAEVDICPHECTDENCWVNQEDGKPPWLQNEASTVSSTSTLRLKAGPCEMERTKTLDARALSYRRVGMFVLFLILGAALFFGITAPKVIKEIIASLLFFL